MARLIQVPYKYSVDVPISVSQAPQKKLAGQENPNPISLDALGLLINLLSYPDDWELHKTELYKRFALNGEKSVRSAWNSLVKADYIIEFKYRVGKKYEYVYYLRKFPFTDEEKAVILDNARKEFGEIWGLRFGESKLETPKGRVNQKTLLNQKTLSNKRLKNDDDKRTSSLSIEEELIISTLREELKDDLTDRSFNAVVRKVVDKHKQGKVKSFRDYLVSSLVAKIEELELRRMKDKANAKIAKNKANTKRETLESIMIRNDLPFYDWLNS